MMETKNSNVFLSKNYLYKWLIKTPAASPPPTTPTIIYAFQKDISSLNS